jgi:hypothetical protein
MTADECRKKARGCRVEALRAWGKLEADFLAAAETWEKLADQVDALTAMAGVITKVSGDAGGSR